VDILSLPNKYVGLSGWTRKQLQRILLAAYCVVALSLLIVALKHVPDWYTAEQAQKQNDGSSDTLSLPDVGTLNIKDIKNYYSATMVPYYVGFYMFLRTLFNIIVEIVKDRSERNKRERVAIYYKALKSR